MKPLPIFKSNEAETTDSSTPLQIQRERILVNILRGMAILGFGLIASYYPRSIAEQNWAGLAIMTGLYAWLLAATFLPRLNYVIRTLSFLGITFVLGLVTFSQDGLYGNGRIYLMIFSVVAGILLGFRSSIAATLLSIVSMVVIYNLIQQGVLPDPNHAFSTSQNLAFWIITFTSFLVGSSAITISMVTLLGSLEKTLKIEKQLTADLEKGQLLLEQKVSQRTEDLERRLSQIRTASEITRNIGGVLDARELIQQVVELLQERFKLYYAGIFLVDEAQKFAVLKSGTGQPGQRMLKENHKLAIGGTSMIGWTIANRKPRIALDVGVEAVRFSNPHLPLTRSEAALPLISGDLVLGAMTIQSSEPEAFDENDLVVLQGIADSLATALDNARLFEQAQKNLNEISNLHRQYLSQAWSDFTRVSSNVHFAYEREEASPAAGPGETIDIPIRLRDQAIGKLTLEIEKSGLSPEEAALVENITTEAALALENVRLLETSQRLASRESLMAELGRKVHSSTDIDSILKTSIRELGIAFNATEGEIRLQTKTETQLPGPILEDNRHQEEDPPTPSQKV